MFDVLIFFGVLSIITVILYIIGYKSPEIRLVDFLTEYLNQCCGKIIYLVPHVAYTEEIIEHGFRFVKEISVFGSAYYVYQGTNYTNWELLAKWNVYGSRTKNIFHTKEFTQDKFEYIKREMKITEEYAGFPE